MTDHPDTDLTDPHGEAEALRRENERLRAERDRWRNDCLDANNSEARLLRRAKAAEAEIARLTAQPDLQSIPFPKLRQRLHDAEAALAAIRAPDPVVNAGSCQPGWKAMAERMGKALQETLAFARALEKQSSRGTAGRRGGAIFARAEAALSDLAKMKGE